MISYEELINVFNITFGFMIGIFTMLIMSAFTLIITKAELILRKYWRKKNDRAGSINTD